MKVHVLQHVPFEGLGSIARWLEGRDAELSYTRFFKNPVLPELKDIDFLIALGGPMSVNDEPNLPWLSSEKKFIRDAIARGVRMLGVCLGSQLIASALGARVYTSIHKEIGWFPVEATPNARGCFCFPATCTVFHWHGETFELPAGAVRLAKNVACENQAFQFGGNLIGLQLHLEATPEGARGIIENCAEELVPGPYIQTGSPLRAALSTEYAKINVLMDEVLCAKASASVIRLCGLLAPTMA